MKIRKHVRICGFFAADKSLPWVQSTDVPICTDRPGFHGAALHTQDQFLDETDTGWRLHQSGASL